MDESRRLSSGPVRRRTRRARLCLFFTEAVMQQDCLPVRMPVPHYQTLPLIALLQSRCLAHTWIYSQKEALVGFFLSLSGERVHTCVLLNTLTMFIKGPAVLTSSANRHQM